MTVPLHIAISADERYMPGAVVAAASLAVHARPETSLVFHLFTEKVNNDTFSFFADTIKRLHANSEVIRHECDDNLLAELPYWAGSRMAAVRCHYASLLPNVDWCLYLDCDVLYLAEVEEHFKYKSQSSYACVVPEELEKTRRHDCAWAKTNCDLDIPLEEYFNSGVMLFNLKKIREDGAAMQLAKFFADHPMTPFADQTALNATFRGNVKLIPPRFNRLQILMTLAKMQEKPVLHYVCGNPWLPKLKCVANHRFRYWHRFADTFVWQAPGVSYRRCFGWKLLAAKYVCYWCLRLPVLGPGFALLMQVAGLTPNGLEWRWTQVSHDIQ